MQINELYQEIILDHGKNPRNKGKCNFNLDADGHNPLCGDKVHIFLNLDKDNVVKDISFEGEGCAISMASASILTEIIKGKDKNFTNKLKDEFLEMIKNKESIKINSLTDDQITTLMSLSGVKKYPMRVKCATMAWHTLDNAINRKEK